MLVDMQNIKGFIETSFIDWPGKTCAVLFLGGCNFRCSFCHNHPLVLEPDKLVSYPLQEIIEKLKPLKKWLGGICISGGEPTLDKELPELLRTFRQEGFSLKIDTNGSRPELLAEIFAENLLEMISMDVKAPLVQEKYDKCAGIRVDLDKVKESIRLIKDSGLDHEFRMTVLPEYHNHDDVVAWAKVLEGSRLKLQNYNPASAMYPALAGSKFFPPDEFALLEKLVIH